MTVTIKQRYENDCFMCCVAMAAGVGYDEALAKWGKDLSDRIATNGVKGASDTDQLLEGIGLKQGRDYAVFSYVRDCKLQPLSDVLQEGQKAIIQVPSLNYEDRYHMVFWDGETLHDPSTARIYTEKNCSVGWVWLLSP